MPAAVYEIIALAMRYVFALLGVLIVLCSFVWLRKDRQLKHQRLKELPDAGTIGLLEVRIGAKGIPAGRKLPVPHEGVLGRHRGCDIVVAGPGVAKKHLDFTFVDGEGLYIHPYHGCLCTVDGNALRNERDCKALPMQHGSLLSVGEVTLRLAVFEGLDVDQYVPELYASEVDE